MKLPIRPLSIPLLLITLTGLSACRNPGNPTPVNSLLKTAESVDARSMQDSVVALAKAVEINQKSSKGFTANGSLKCALGDQKGAIEDFTKAIELDPGSIAAYSGRATARFSAGDLSGAIADALEAAKLVLFSKIGNG